MQISSTEEERRQARETGVALAENLRDLAGSRLFSRSVECKGNRHRDSSAAVTGQKPNAVAQKSAWNVPLTLPDENVASSMPSTAPEALFCDSTSVCELARGLEYENTLP